MINSFFCSAEDAHEKSVIDDFAKYVARNGIECEMMTKHKQQGNPLFEFLFGGRYSDYYRHKLEEERHIMHNEEYGYQHGPGYVENNTLHSYTPSSNQFEHGYDFTQTEYFQGTDVLSSMNSKLEQERTSLQIMQDEHYRILSESQQHLNDETAKLNKERIPKCMMIVNTYRLSQSKKLCQDCGIDFQSMEMCMEAILISCTKDNICSGKNWVIENCGKADNYYPLSMYLLAKVSISAEFNERLHIVYFINDLLHHCKRKNIVKLLEALESVVVPIYSLCILLADEEGKTKLNKVLSLWESNSYTKKELLDSMRQNHVNSSIYLDNWCDIEINMMKRAEDEGLFRDVYLTNDGETIGRYINDSKMRLGSLEDNHNQLKYELKIKEEAIQLAIYQMERDIKIYELESRKMHEEAMQREYNCYQENQRTQNTDFDFQMPDISQPPPGFQLLDMPHGDSMQIESSIINQPMPVQEYEQPVELVQLEEKAVIPYWRLPAALMVAHIRLSQFEYKPINPKEMRMPQLRPPNRRLMDISNTFYQLPSHDRPRDTEGWERLALHDFLKAKEKAKIGEIVDDFVNSLHQDNEEEEDDDYGFDYRQYGGDDDDFRRHFPPPGTLSHEYRQPLQHYGPTPTNYSPRTVVNQRSLLGSPWQDHAPSRSYNNGTHPLTSGGTTSSPRLVPPKVVPLMSLGLPGNIKRQSAPNRSRQGMFSRHNDHKPDESSYARTRSRRRRRYSSRSRSRSRSVSPSRSRSHSSAYSRSRSRSYSRSRSDSRSRSRSSPDSSRSSGQRPYKGGFIARKRSRSGSRSRSLSRSPKPRVSHDSNYNSSSLMQNLPDRRVWSGMRSELPGNVASSGGSGSGGGMRMTSNDGMSTGVMRSEQMMSTPMSSSSSSQVRNEDPFSRFRQQKSAGYTEWMKDRVVQRRPFEEETMDNF